MKRVLAFVCRICPFCIVARRLPHSRYAHAMARLEKRCPACKAYADLHGDTIKTRS